MEGGEKLSLKTWKAEFYPVEAKDVPEAEALAHSHRKWLGLLKENLERHGLKKIGYDEISDGFESLEIDCDSCAMCVHYDDCRTCPKCPLSKARGRRCDDARTGTTSPYGAFTASGDPEPMIALIELAISKQEAAT